MRTTEVLYNTISYNICWLLSTCALSPQEKHILYLHKELQVKDEPFFQAKTCCCLYQSMNTIICPSVFWHNIATDYFNCLHFPNLLPES